MPVSIASASGVSAQRPVPLRGRTDLHVSWIDFQGVQHAVVKDPVALQFFRLRGEQFRLLELLDGRRSWDELKRLLAEAFPSLRPTLRDVQQLVADLHQKGLAYGTRAGQAEGRLQQQRERRLRKVWQTVSNLLAMRLPGWDPDRVLQWMLPGTGWFFHPVMIVASAIFVAASWVVLFVQFDQFHRGLPAFEQFFGWPNLLWLWITLAVAKVMHEFGHGLSCRRYGAQCHEMGVMLLVLTPCLYCDVSDSWMLRNKWQRIMIGAAGMYVEAVLSAAAIFIWWLTAPGFWHYLALNLFFVTAVTTIIFNANPLLRLDGYYMLSDFLEIPNLREKAGRVLREAVALTWLGTPPTNDPFRPRSGHFWFGLYAVLSSIYGWLVLAGILFFLYTFLKPHQLQSLGATVAVVSLATIVTNIGREGYQMWKQPRRDPVPQWRLWLGGGVVLGVVAAVLCVPIPWLRRAAFVVEPQAVKHVTTKVPGELTELAVQPGDRVEAGQVLARLSDPQKELQREELKLELELRRAQRRSAQAADDHSGAALADQAARSVERELEELDAHLALMIVTASVSGTVVAPERTPEPSIEESRQRLPGWHGTPLDPRNHDCFLPERTHLLSIAPTDRMQTVIYLEQGDRPDVHNWMRLRLKFDHLPDRTYSGHVREVAEAQADIVPAALSNKQGGSLSTVTNPAGQERLEHAAYQAIVELNDQPIGLRSGQRGEARFVVFHRSLGQWLRRWLRTTFQFRL